MRFFLLFLTFIFVDSSLFARTVSLNLKGETPTFYAVKSLVLPGWGQFSAGEKKKGYLFGGMTATFFVFSYYFYSKADEQYKKYEERGLKDDPLYDEYKSNFNTGNLFLYGGIIAWGYNVFDAYKMAKKKFAYSENKRFFISFSPRKIEFNFVF